MRQTLRHDAFGNLDVTAESEAEEAIPGLQIPLPVVGPYSPGVLAFRMLAKASLVFGGYVLALRLVYLMSPDLARFGASALAAVFAIALVVHWFSASRAVPEWAAWVGAAVLVLFCADSLLPALGLLRGVTSQGSLPALIEPLIQAALLVLVLVQFLLPAVKRTTSSFSRGPLTVGLIAAFLGGKLGTSFYYPESDFSAWSTFAVCVLFSGASCFFIADQYVRFQEAMDPGRHGVKQLWYEKWLGNCFLKYAFPAPVVLLVALWFGNSLFLHHLGWSGASLLGLFTFLGLLALWTWVDDPLEPRRPYRAACAALSFFLTYNLQRVSNPNVYQLGRPFREPLARLGLVAFTVGVLGVGLLHLSGVQAPPGSNRVRMSDHLSVANYCLPQSYPRLFEGEQLCDASRATYRRHAEKVAAEGDAPLPTATPVRSLADLAFRAAVVLAGGPLLFFFLLATTQGHFLAAKEGRPEDG
jgi:hypothetical protein